jgi:hypothetical protein
VHHAQLFAKATPWKHPLAREPREIFHRKIVDRHTMRWKMRRSKFAERHVRLPDFREILGNVASEAGRIEERHGGIRNAELAMRNSEREKRKTGKKTEGQERILMFRKSIASP